MISIYVYHNIETIHVTNVDSNQCVPKCTQYFQPAASQATNLSNPNPLLSKILSTLGYNPPDLTINKMIVSFYLSYVYITMQPGLHLERDKLFYIGYFPVLDY